ncbi:MAG: hypothetical protein AAF614_23010 [Chloroflexota bacterium]
MHKQICKLAILIIGIGLLASRAVAQETPPFGAPDFPWVTGFDLTVPQTGQPMPALNARFQDEVYGTTIQRISAPIESRSSSWVRHEYSRRPAFNTNSSHILMFGDAGWWHLFRVDGEDVVYEKDVPTMAEPNWHPTDPNRYYYFAPFGFGLQILEYNIVTEQSQVVADFNGRLPWPNIEHVWTGQEGRPSANGRIWCLMAEDANYQTLGIFAYDLQTDQILGTLDMSNDPDHISTSVNGNYCVPSVSDFDGTGSTMGTRAYTLDFSTFTQLYSSSSHSDIALNAAGEDVLVVIDYSTGPDGGWLKMVHMATAEVTRLVYNYDNVLSSFYALHISGLAVDVPGYIVLSTYGAGLNHGERPATYGDIWGHDRLAIVELAENPTVYNVAYMHGQRPTNGVAGGYFGEPHATVNRDLSRILFTSTWESEDANDIRTYMVTLKEPAAKMFAYQLYLPIARN